MLCWVGLGCVVLGCVVLFCVVLERFSFYLEKLVHSMFTLFHLPMPGKIKLGTL